MTEWIEVPALGQREVIYLPGRCQHHDSEPVRLLLTNELVARICTTCWQQLPPDWRQQERFDDLIYQVSQLDARLDKLSELGTEDSPTWQQLTTRRRKLWQQAHDIAFP